MPTLADYQANGGYAKDSQAQANLYGKSNFTLPTSSNSSAASGGVTGAANAYINSLNNSGGSSSSGGGLSSPSTATGGSSAISSPGGGGYVAPPAAFAAPQVPVFSQDEIQKMINSALSQQKSQYDGQIGTLQDQYKAMQNADLQRQQAEAAAAQQKQGFIDAQTPLYDKYFNDQQMSQLAALRNSRDTALQTYNQSQNVASQQAYQNSNQVDAQHAQAAQKLRELMASQGLLSSGDNVTANVQLENQRQNSLNDINQTTANTLQDIQEKRNLLQNQAASQEQSLADKISSDKTQALIDLQRYGDQKATDLTKFNYGTYQDALNNQFRGDQASIQNQLAAGQLTGQYNGQATLAAVNAARQDALARAGLTGTLDGQQTLAATGQAFNQSMGLADRTGILPDGRTTLAAQQMDRQGKVDNWNAYLQSVGLTGDLGNGPKSDWSLLGDRTGNLTLTAQQAALQNALSEAGVTGMYNNNPTMAKTAQDAQYSGMYNGALTPQARQLNASIANMGADNARAQAAAAQSKNNQEQQRLIEIWKTQGKAPAGIDNVAEGTPYAGIDKPKGGPSDSDVNSFSSQLTKLYTKQDDKGNVVVTNPEALKNAVIAQYYPNDQLIDKVLVRFGINPKQ